MRRLDRKEWDALSTALPVPSLGSLPISVTVPPASIRHCGLHWTKVQLSPPLADHMVACCAICMSAAIHLGQRHFSTRGAESAVGPRDASEILVDKRTLLAPHRTL